MSYVPDKIYAHKFTGEQNSGKWCTVRIYTANWEEYISAEKHESDLAAKQVELLREIAENIMMLEIGSCTCMTKTFVHDEHTENCLFRRICNVEDMIQDKINKLEGK